VGTQQLPVGAGVPIHRHFQMDESFYVLEGSGILILNDVRHPFDKGGTIFIPRNSWHGFANPDHEVSCSGLCRLLALMVFSAKLAIRPACRPNN
jgi:quercetin dioxygenase-like cupin family protein